MITIGRCKFKFIDIVEFLILLTCIAIIDLFSEYNWITTGIFIPGITLLYIIVLKSKILTDKFLKSFILLLLLAIVSIIFINSFEEYILEIKRFLGVVAIIIIANSSIKRNSNNIYLFYTILLLKYLFLIYFTYKSGVIQSSDIELDRLQTGYDIGINANVYGYFAFLAIYSSVLIFYNKSQFYFIALLSIVIFTSLYVNLYAASRAGLIFTLLSGFLIYLAVNYKTLKNLILKLTILLPIIFIVMMNLLVKFDNLFIVKRFIGFSDSLEDTRVDILNEGIELFLKNPLGVGAGQFPIHVHSAASHNGFLLVAANYGIFALLVYLNIFIFLIKKSVTLYKSNIKINQKFSLIYLSYILLFFFYNFFYDMVLNSYLILMFTLVNLNIDEMILKNIPSNKFD